MNQLFEKDNYYKIIMNSTNKLVFISWELKTRAHDSSKLRRSKCTNVKKFIRINILYRLDLEVFK